MPLRLDSQKRGFFRAVFAAFSRSSARRRRTSSRLCARIVAEVAARGDKALLELTAKFDRIDLAKTGLRVTAAEIEAAAKACEGEALAALKARPRPYRGLSSPPKAERRAFHGRSRRRDGREVDCNRSGRSLRSGWYGRLSVLGSDECGAGQGRRRTEAGNGRPDAGWQAQPSGAGGGKACWRR